MTFRRILVAIVVGLVLIVAIYRGYTNYDAKRAGANGEVYSVDAPPGKAKGEGLEATAPDTSAKPAPARVTAASPDEDTISSNPVNGERFTGRGRYQLYRQGNITWRLDTDTGRTCIIFATDEEWEKPKVLKAGCGSL